MNIHIALPLSLILSGHLLTDTLRDLLCQPPTCFLIQSN